MGRRTSIGYEMRQRICARAHADTPCQPAHAARRQPMASRLLPAGELLPADPADKGVPVSRRETENNACRVLTVTNSYKEGYSGDSVELQADHGGDGLRECLDW